MMHYYNEHNAYRAAVLRERMAEGFLPKGVVDERDICSIPDNDWIGYTQIHLFAGIGGFPLGLRAAGFPEDRRIITGGFPCQDISNAGKRAGITGTRSGLWREMVRCIRVVRPEIVFVENVAALLCRGMGEVLGDLAEIGYDAEGDCISAADVGAPHLRRRIWIVAHAHDARFASEWHSGPAWGDGAACASGELAHAAQPRIGRLPARRWSEGERTSDTERNGETLSDAANDGIGRRKQFTESSQGTRGVADTAQRRQPMRGESSGRDGLAARGGEAMANANGGRCEQRHQGEWSIPVTDAGSLADSIEDRWQRPEREELARTGEGRQHTAPSRSSRWPVEPNVGRVANGIPKRVDRLAALGDAIVPACVEEVVRRFFPEI